MDVYDFEQLKNCEFQLHQASLFTKTCTKSEIRDIKLDEKK